MPKAASHRRVAFSSMASNTGVRSPGEELMTCKTSGRGLALQPFVTLGSTIGKLALQIGYELFGIG